MFTIFRSMLQRLESIDESLKKMVAHQVTKQNTISDPEDTSVDDDMYQEALNMVRSRGSASASLLQHHLRVGYARAARLLDLLEEQGEIGPADGAKPRKVLIDRLP